MSTWQPVRSFKGIATYEDFLRELARDAAPGVSDNNALWHAVMNHPGMMTEEQWEKGKRVWEAISKIRP